MDIQTGLVCLGIAVLSAVVLFVISFLGMKEKTYEEAIAEQRKMPEEHLLLGRSAKDKARDKKQKKAGKKVKEKPSEREKSEHTEVRTSAPAQQEKVHVDFEEPEAEVVSERPPQRWDVCVKGAAEVAPEPAPPAKIVQVSVKAAVTSKMDKTQAPKPAAPKEERAAVKVDKAVSSSTPPPIPAPAPPVVVKQEVQQQPPPQNTAPPTKERSRKKRSELATLQQMSGDRDGVNVSLLMPLLQKAVLSRSENQILIDLLLNKQQGSAVGNSEWIEGRQDPMVKLKKQLSEKEKSLSEEQEASQALQSKLKELRTELNSERSRLTHSVRQLEEALAGKQSEAQALAARLQHSHDALIVEKQQLTQQVQQLQQKLSEEHVRMRAAQEEQNALSQELMAQRQQLEMHIAHLSEQEEALKVQVDQLEGVNATLNAELQSQQGRAAHAEGQLLHYKEGAERAQEHHVQHEAAMQFEASRLRSDLDEVQDEASHLQLDVQRLRKENELLNDQVSLLANMQREAQQLREENESLAAQVTAVTERPAAEGRENGDVHYPEEKQAFLQHDDIVEQEESMLVQLGEELKLKDCLVEKLKCEVNAYKTDVSKLSEELEEQRRKNNELRKKNWKAMDALSALEKSVQTKGKQSPDETSENVREEERTAVRQLLQRIFPDISVEDSKVHNKWLERFESSAQAFLVELKARPHQQESPSDVLIELEKQNSHLQAMLSHYKTIIDDTEGMLNKLQSHVEQEEARWRQQLQLKDAELEAALELVTGVTEMQTKVQELEAKLEAEEGEKQDLGVKYETACGNMHQLEEERQELSAELQQECERRQELSHEVIKLRSQVQIGVDSLTQEQALVQQLQQQLNVTNQNHSVATNGPASEASVPEGGSVKK